MNPAEDFSGKVVLITGASSGIGAATAEYFSNLGAKLALTGRNFENLQKVGEKCAQSGNQEPLLIVADLTKEEDVKKIMSTTIEHFKKLDVLINNAGVSKFGSIETSTLDWFDKIFNTNLRAVYQLTQLAVPYLIASEGNIVNVSSISGFKVVQNLLIYSMSKSALDHFTRITAMELAQKHVRVNSVQPGVIFTNMITRGGLTSQKFLDELTKLHPVGRIGQPEEVARVIAFLASDKAGFITGINVPVDGGSGIDTPQIDI